MGRQEAVKVYLTVEIMQFCKGDKKLLFERSHRRLLGAEWLKLVVSMLLMGEWKERIRECDSEKESLKLPCDYKEIGLEVYFYCQLN